VVLKTQKGDIFEKEFMETLRQVTEEVFYLKGVERSSVTSLFTPNVRYNEVVEDGSAAATSFPPTSPARRSN